MAIPPIQMMLSGGAPQMRKTFLGKWGFNATSFATSIGAADPTRVLVVAGAGNIISGVQFNGNAMTNVALHGNAGIWALAWPTGTSGTFGVTGFAFFNLSSYVIYGSASAVVSDNLAGNGNIDKFAGGVTIGAVHAATGSGHTWSGGLTADWSESGSGYNDGAATYLNLGATALNSAVSVSPASSAAYASWKPAGT